MSWISDLAGKAENILNKIDQNAANVLKFENDEKSSSLSSPEKSLVDDTLSIKTLSPKKILNLKNAISSVSQRSPNHNGNTVNNNQQQIKSNSRLSSRRSSLSSKTDDSQIAVQFDLPLIGKESENEGNSIKDLANLQIALAEVTLERNDLRDEVFHLQKDLKEATGLVRIQELETLVSELNGERQHLNGEISDMKLSCREYITTITELETNLSKARQTILELSDKIDWQTKETNQHVTELEQYRKKAQSTLQIKDKLIAELREKLHKINSNNDVLESYSSDAEKILQMEIDELRQENENLNEELKLMNLKLEESKNLLQQIQQNFNDNLEEQSKREESLRDALNKEQQKSMQFVSDIKILNQELLAVREEMNQQRHSYSLKLHEKDNEIEKLQVKQSEIVLYSDTSILEERIQSLTQALVQKQSAIETITAEKNALKLQLEKMNDKLRLVVAQSKANHSQIINVNDTDDAKAQLPFIMRENPFDTNVTRRVKRAYSSLDSAGIRVGVFLRRYPLVRIMVFIYVALLHLWVMFVLLSSTPT